LIENNKGKINFCSFLLPNKKEDISYKDCTVSVEYLEFRTGLQLWNRLEGAKVQKAKTKSNLGPIT